MVKEYNLNRFEVTGRLLADSDTGTTGATIRLNDDTLAYESGLYGFEISPATMVSSGMYLLSLEDSVGLNASLSATLPDSFSITIVVPATRINNGGDQVSVEWSAASGADGYILATVPADSTYTGQGFSVWANSLTTAGTIVPDAFRWSDGVNLDLGWYYVYVYAYAGAPDSALSAESLPCPLPSQLPDNIDDRDFSGRFGSVSVAIRDSVLVAVQP